MGQLFYDSFEPLYVQQWKKAFSLLQGHFDSAANNSKNVVRIEISFYFFRQIYNESIC